MRKTEVSKTRMRIPGSFFIIPLTQSAGKPERQGKR